MVKFLSPDRQLYNNAAVAAVVLQVLYRNCTNDDVRFEILSNPEFLAEGTAIRDLEAPDRVRMGHGLGGDNH